MVKDSKIDKVLIVVSSVLILFGFFMVYSSTMILSKARYGDDYHFVKKQLIWLVGGLILTILIATLKNPWYLESKVVFGLTAVSTVALILVFFTGKINNSYRWIKIGIFSIQPSEFAKIAIVLYIAYMFSRENFDINDIKKLAVTLIPVFGMQLLIIKEPDLGNFFLILIITLILLYTAGLKLQYFIYSIIGLTPLVYLIIKMNPEKFNRILAFLNPEEYAATYGFQAMQSVYAVGSGGVFGKGIGNSTQKLFFLPYAYSDFIFAIVGEELGLVGAIIMIVLFFVFLMRGIRIARYSGSRQTYLMVIGLTFLIVTQAMINISVTIGIFPTKGIPLPFISNGGSSLVASLLITGLILNVSRLRKTELKND